MSDQDNIKSTKLKKVLSRKRTPPAWQQLSIEPKEAGSVVNISNKNITKTPKLPPLQELSNEPVLIKAINKEELPVNYSNKFPKITSVADDNFLPPRHNFVPPKDNFVSVGQKDHTWYSKEVTGDMVDNNDKVDIDALQGHNPLEGVQTSILPKVLKQFELIQKRVIQSISTVNDIDELQGLKLKFLGQQGIVYALVSQMSSTDRAALSETINDFISDLSLEFESKEHEFLLNEDNEGDLFELEESSEDDEDFDPEEDAEEDTEDNQFSGPVKISSMLPEGGFAVLIDDQLITIVENAEQVKNVISRLVLERNVKISNIQLIKRIPIDFGVIINV